MNTFEEIQTALENLSALLVEKGVPVPRAEFSLKSDGRLCLYVKAPGFADFDGKDYEFLYGEDAEKLFRDAAARIAALPSPEETVTREYLTRVASAVDYATEHSIADEYVEPLRGVTCTMTENLLEVEK